MRYDAVARTQHSGATPLDSMLKPEPWTRDALCAQTDADAFFPENGESSTTAKAICAACDVRAQCLEYALRTKQRHGIWAGLSPRGLETRRLKK